MHKITWMILVALLLNGCNRPSSTSSLHLGEGGAITSEGLNVSNGNLVLNEGQTGLAFAFVTRPGQPNEFTYFLVFNHEYPIGGFGTQARSDGSSASTSHTIQAHGAECKVEYRVELTPDKNTVKSETILIGDSTFESSKGKVFLIDMKTSPPTVTQWNLELPSDIPDLKTTDATLTFGQDTLNQFRKTEKIVDAFCRRIETKGR